MRFGANDPRLESRNALCHIEAAVSALKQASPIDRPVEDPWGSEDGRGFRWALVVSLLAHGALFWGVQEGRNAAADGSDVDEAMNDAGFEVSLVYVDVPVEASEQEPDAETEFYSERSTRAADNTVGADDSRPQIEGSQDEVFRLEDVAPPTEPVNADPTPRTEETAPSSESNPVQETASPTTAQEPPPASPLTSEDRALLETLFGNEWAQSSPPSSNEIVPEVRPPQEQSSSASPASDSSRPRTLAEARRRQALAGETVRQEGGAEDKAATALVDTKGRTFGSYDRNIQLAVQARWYAMIEERVSYVRTRGRVQIGFRMHQDGSLSRARVVETTVDPIMTSLCRAAITEPAPYGEWPQAMRDEIGESHRDIVFTFHYR